MKKVIFLIFFSLFLVACGGTSLEVNENIREVMAEDSIGIVDIVETSIDEERSFTTDEQNTIDEYTSDYSDPTSVEEANLAELVTSLVDMQFTIQVLGTDSDTYRGFIDGIEEVIVTGHIN